VIVLLLALLVPLAASAQENPPVLRAHSRTVDVQDGDRLLKGIWACDPRLELDTYAARRSDLKRSIRFISDLDSISFDVEPGRSYDFIVLLDGKDACRTRISTLMQTCKRSDAIPAGPVTIPITISHGKLHLQGRINESEMLDLIFDTGADMSVVYPSGKRKGAELQLDGRVSNGGTGGMTLRQQGRDNRLEVAGLQWEHEPILYVEKQSDAADGIVGYPAFEQKVVEIDYDRMVMVVHDALPPSAAEFSKVPMTLAGSLTAVEAVLVHGAATDAGAFVLDTAGSGTLMVNPAFAAAAGFHAALTKLGTSTSRGVGSGSVESEVLLLPELRLAGFTLHDVPIHVELSSEHGQSPPGGLLCMEVLARFNTLLDYSRYEAYFKPNASFDAPFETRSWGRIAYVLAGVALVCLGSIAWWARMAATRRRRPR